MNRRPLLAALLVLAVLGGACSSDGGSSPAAGSPSAGSARSAALRFFKQQEPACADFAEANGNPPVEPARFQRAKASAVRAGGTVEIVDGMGTALVVDVKRHVVLPIGGEAEVTPPPYEFGCPSDVFLGAAHD